MNKISIITAPELRENGSMFIKEHHTVSAVVRELSDKYDIRLVLKGEKPFSELPGKCSIIYDASRPEYGRGSFPTYTQKNYFSWENAGLISEEESDVLLCMDAFYPWALAACKRLMAKEKILWVNDAPELFLLEDDISVFYKIYCDFDRIIFADDKCKTGFEKLFPELDNVSETVPYPVDREYYRRLAHTEWENCFSENETNIVVPASFDTENPVMLIPKLALEYKQRSEKMHFFIFGSGKFKNHFLRDMVLNDVCEEITLADDNVFYPMLSSCDYIMLLPGQNSRELFRAAQAYEKEIIKETVIENALTAGNIVRAEDSMHKTFKNFLINN